MTFDLELRRLRPVFFRLWTANLKLSPKKCELFRRKVKFLGPVVCEDGVTTDPGKVKAVQNWPVPHNAKAVVRFVGLCNYYRRCVCSFSDVARPLHQLCEKGQPFEGTKKCNDSFQQLKAALVSATVLAYPHSAEPFLLDTDASNVGIGAVLSQVHYGDERVIAYYSRAPSKPQRNFCTTRRKLLGVVRAIENFHPYLYGRKFTVRTDHASLQWLLSFNNLEGQLARWLEKLQSYDFCTAYRAGKIHQNADALSLRPCLETNCVHCQRQEEREFREGGLNSKANDALPVETPNRVVRELQSSSSIP